MNRKVRLAFYIMVHFEQKLLSVDSGDEEVCLALACDVAAVVGFSDFVAGVALDLAAAAVLLLLLLLPVVFAPALSEALPDDLLPEFVAPSNLAAVFANVSP